MVRDFDSWLEGFRDSIASYSYYTDFEKVVNNVEEIKLYLNMMNVLIGAEDIEEKFEKLVEKYPEVLACVPILIASRESRIFAQDADGMFWYDFKSPNLDIEQYKVFMRKTGLFNMLQNHLVSNLVDYVFGIETGLDSNARKNRGGHQMEDLVERFIRQADLVKDETYFKELNLSTVEDMWGLDLSALSNDGKAEKRFDFVIKAGDTVYAIETNFYRSGGSKLNETSRSFKMLAIESQGIENFEFVWITDGCGWQSAKKNLRETFEVMEHIYSIQDLENGALAALVK